MSVSSCIVFQTTNIIRCDCTVRLNDIECWHYLSHCKYNYFDSSWFFNYFWEIFVQILLKICDLSHQRPFNQHAYIWSSRLKALFKSMRSLRPLLSVEHILQGMFCFLSLCQLNIHNDILLRRRFAWVQNKIKFETETLNKMASRRRRASFSDDEEEQSKFCININKSHCSKV